MSGDALPYGARKPSTHEAGRAAEEVAVRATEAAGWFVVARNWRARSGEIDIVASKGEELAFIEVKSVDAYGPESAERLVDARKRGRIVETSQFFLAANREYKRMSLRYDVILVRAGRLERWLERAFPGNP
ncbi:MAG: YraN family protein [Spirochaetales bacterium]|nr:YraN family protein [Spirochaetales bacterium]